MRGLIDRLKTGRLALAALGVVAALGGTAALTTAAQARDHDGYYRDNWRHERWEREHWRRVQAEREAEWRRWHRWHDGRVYYDTPPPAYYTPPAYYYGEPRVGFGFTIRN